VEIRGTITTTDVVDLIAKAAFAGETDGSYLLQAAAGQTAVLTGIHTVLLRRVPAGSAPATVVAVDSACAGAGPPPPYNATIDLDAANLTPELTHAGQLTQMATPVTDLATVVTQDQPVSLSFDATTSKFDVTWQLRFDYAMDGQAHSATLPTAGASFQTDAIAPGDTWLTVTLNPNGGTWSASAAATEQYSAQLSGAESGLASDYNSLSGAQSSLDSELSDLNPAFIGQDLSATLRDERRVLGAAKAGDSAVCAGASTVAADANRVANDAQDWDDNQLGAAAIDGSLGGLGNAVSTLNDDLQTLFELEPGFNGNADTPSPAQVRHADSTALAADTKALSAVNAMINRVNADVATAHAYAVQAAAAGHGCRAPGPAPAPIRRVS
jgi:hypothetical protein